MARARNTGGTGLGWVAVIFGVGFGFLLVLSIVFYYQLGEARSEAEQAKADLAAVISSSQQSDERVVSLEQDRKDTIVGHLLASNEDLLTMVGTPGQTAAAAQAAVDQEQIDGSLIDEVRQLRQSLKASEQRVEQASSNLAQAEQRARTAQQQMSELGGKYDQSLGQLKQQLKQAEDEHAAYEQRVAQMEQKLRQQIEQSRQQYQQRLAELSRQNEDLSQEAGALESRITQLMMARGGVEAPDVLQPDARVVSVLPDSGQIYLNLGRKHHLVPGMTFEVFDRNDLVKPVVEENQRLRGKATVEVVNVNEASSVARVVRRERQGRIDEGDQLINAVYDPTATYTFRVYGQFDLDGQGQPGEVDRNRIENMIQRWGGKVSEELDYEVDFLVLGVEPPLPDPLPTGTIDPVALSEYNEAVRNYERYQELIAQARSLSIPVLNQNRFLSLIGYYQR